MDKLCHSVKCICNGVPSNLCLQGYLKAEKVSPVSLFVYVPFGRMTANAMKYLVHICVDGVRLRLWTAATHGPIVNPQTIYEYVELRWNGIDRGNRRTRWKSYRSATLSVINPTWIDAGANPSPRGERPVTKLPELWHFLRNILVYHVQSMSAINQTSRPIK
jgi:hypothetical protein